jgi:hypothetical protein
MPCEAVADPIFVCLTILIIALLVRLVVGKPSDLQ